MSFNLTIKNKLITLGSVAVLTSAILAGASYHSNRQIDALSDEALLRNDYSDVANQLERSRLELLVGYYATANDKALGRASDEDMAQILKPSRFLREKTEELLSKNLSYIDNDKLRDQLPLIGEVIKGAQEDLPRMITAHAKPEEFEAATNAYEDKLEKLAQSQLSITAQIDKAAQQVTAEAGDVINAANEELLVVFLVSLGAMAALLSVITLSITRPLKSLSHDIERIAEGDYTRELDGADKGDEIADMVKSLNLSVRKTKEIVTAIRTAAQSVNAAATEIATGSADLSMRTEQQASNLEETAASMEEITGTVKANSQNAGSANELSTRANHIAGEGGRVVEEAVGAMKSIEKSSQKISDIIGVIDEIAFQTNLLALNAAVEAARAGDAGKGFAVVASEVRSLAGRSASASKEIKALINESAGQVKTGATLVNQAGDTLKEIVGSVRQVASIISEIAAASTQQATGVDEINSSIMQMDEMTQQNAALVEENTAATQSMSEQARTLEKLLTFFKVDDSHVQDAFVETPRPAVKAAPRAFVKAQKPALAKLAAVKTAPKPAPVVAKQVADAGWEEF